MLRVVGESLEERIEKGPLPLQDALEIAPNSQQAFRRPMRRASSLRANSIRYPCCRMKRSAVGDLFWTIALLLAAIYVSLGVGVAQTSDPNCSTVRMDPDEVIIPAEGGDIDATLTIGPVSDPDCEAICLFSFSRPGFTLSGCSGDGRCRLVWEFPFQPTGNPNECTTSLTNPIPPNSGPPRMGTLYSYSGPVTLPIDRSLAVDSLVIRQEGVGTSSGCRIVPKTTYLSPHRPEFYLPVIARYIGLPERKLRVVVTDLGAPAVGLPVSIIASQPAFPGETVLPETTSAMATTNQGGVAEFVINPLANKPFDETEFTATVQLNGEDVSCQASVVAGTGARLAPYLARLPDVVDMLEMSGQLVWALQEYFPVEFAETDAQALEKEMIELLQRRARIDPTSFPRVLAKWRKHRPTIRAYLDKGLVSVTPQLVADLRGALKLLLEEGSPRLLAIRSFACPTALRSGVCRRVYG